MAPSCVVLKTFRLCLFSLFILNKAVFSQPVIRSFAPIKGPAGTQVVITGSGFSTTLSGNIVFFGAARADVLAASTNSLTVKVPTGATYTPLGVTVNGLTAYTQSPFLVAFPGGGSIDKYSFGSKSVYTTLTYPDDLVAVDLDGDGRPDIVSTTGYSYAINPSISVLQNTSRAGSISFASQVDILAGMPQTSVAFGDLDGDGKPDIAVSTTANSVSIFRNTSTNGVISFAPRIDFATGKGSAYLAIGDIDGDGRPDLSTVNGTDSSVSILLNGSSPGNIQFNPKQDFNTAPGSGSITMGDLDGDSKPELIVCLTSRDSIQIFHNASTVGKLSFTYISYPVVKTPRHAAIGDLDGDGRPEIIVSNYIPYLPSDTCKISIYRNLSNAGNLAFAPKFDRNTGDGHTGPWHISLGDLDGDGLTDVAVVNQTENILTLLKNNSEPGKFIFPDLVNVDVLNFNNTSPYSMCIADFDGDGKPDLAEANSGLASVSVFRNQINETAILSFTPTTSDSGKLIQIVGRMFTGTTAVSFGGNPASSFRVISDTLIAAYVGNGASGAVSVTSPKGTCFLNTFTYINPLAPILKAFAPQSGDIANEITLTGKYFLGVTQVSIGGTPAASFTIQSDSVMTVLLGHGSSGQVRISSRYGADSLGGFTFRQKPVTPMIRSFTPDSVAKRGLLKIYGQHFTGTTAILIGGVPPLGFFGQGDTSLSVLIGYGATGSVLVRSPSGYDSLNGFVYLPSSYPPHLKSFSPAAAKPDDLVQITGKGLFNVNAVSLGGIPAYVFTVVSDTLINLIVGSGSSGYVSVSNEDGKDSLAYFTFLDSTRHTPVITSFSPASAGTGDTVYLSGNHFTGTSSVSFGGTSANAFSVLSDSLLQAIVGLGSSGVVSVTTPAGSATLDGFIYLPSAVHPSFRIITFTGMTNNNLVQLDWTAAQDSLVAQYVVERSMDSILFTFAAQTANTHNSYTENIYHATDYLTVQSPVYYRLRALSADGQLLGSSSLLLTSTGSGPVLLIYPNPAKNYVVIANPLSPVVSQFRILTTGGTLIQQVQVNPGVTQTSINIFDLPPGLYRVFWTDGSTQISSSFFVY